MKMRNAGSKDMLKRAEIRHMLRLTPVPERVAAAYGAEVAVNEQLTWGVRMRDAWRCPTRCPGVSNRVSNGLTLSPQHVIKASFVQPRMRGLGVLDRVGMQSPGQREALLSLCEAAACRKSGQPFSVSP